MDIPFPRLPTDNLYKFLALSGVLLMVVGYALPVYSTVHRSTLARPILREQVNRLARQSVVISQYTHSNAAFKANDGRAARALRDSATRLNDSLKATAALADEAYDEYKDDNSQLDDLKWVGLLFVLIGGVSAIWGFRNWYVMLQRPLDQILQREAAGLKSGAGDLSGSVKANDEKES